MKQIIHKLTPDEEERDDYDLIGLNTLLEDYLLAYAINQKLNLNLKRQPRDLMVNIEADRIGFSFYEYTDDQNGLYWALIQNKRIWQTTNEDSNLLFTEIDKKAYLLPKTQNVDYFLRIEGLETNKEELMHKLRELQKNGKLSGLMMLDSEYIKTKLNIIF